MTFQFAVSPDVPIKNLSNWYILNTRLQKCTGEPFHMTPYDDFKDLHEAVDKDSVDLIFANAADTALLVREHGFSPIARPSQVSDEAMVVVAAESSFNSPKDLPSPLSVAATDAPDVERICRILLEPFDLGRGEIQLELKRNYVLVAKELISGSCQAGFFLKAAMEDLSSVTRGMLRPLLSSSIYVVYHSLLASPKISHLSQAILSELTSLSTQAGRELLEGLGAPHGWEAMLIEEAEFIADLMDTLER